MIERNNKGLTKVWIVPITSSCCNPTVFADCHRRLMMRMMMTTMMMTPTSFCQNLWQGGRKKKLSMFLPGSYLPIVFPQHCQQIKQWRSSSSSSDDDDASLSSWWWLRAWAMAILTSNPGQELQGTRHPHLNLPPPHQHHHHPIIITIIIPPSSSSSHHHHHHHHHHPLIISATTELQTKSVFH